MSGNNQPNLTGWAAILTAIATIITAIGFPDFLPDLAKQFLQQENNNLSSVQQDKSLSDNKDDAKPSDHLEQDEELPDTFKNKTNHHDPIAIDEVEYEFVDCQQSSQRIRCTVIATNQAVDKSFRIHAKNSRIITSGEVYVAESVSLGNQTSFDSSTKTELVNDISINLYINFDRVDDQLTTLNLLEFEPSYSEPVQFRDIRLSQ